MTYSEPDGIVAYVRELNSTKTPIHDPIYFKGVSDQIEVEVAFQFVDAFEENVLGFCNNILHRRAARIWRALRRVLPR